MNFARTSQLTELSSQNFEAYADFKGQLVKYETLSRSRASKYEETSELWKINEALQQLLKTLPPKEGRLLMPRLQS
jgi:hypothetical protein